MQPYRLCPMKKILLTALLFLSTAPCLLACLDMELEDETLVIPVFESQSVNPGDAYFGLGDDHYIKPNLYLQLIVLPLVYE
jgi:hypothetical protein